MIRNLILSAIGFFILPMISTAQCCSAGNPFFYGEQTTLDGKLMQLAVGYKYGEMDTYYNGSTEIEISDIERSWFNYLNFQVLYGFTHRLSIQADLGYFLNKSESYYKEDWSSKAGYGLGDAGITAKYLAFKNHVRKFSVVPSVGLIIPIGVFDQEIENVKLPISLQPSSGSFKYPVAIYMNKGFKSPKINLGFFGSFEYAQRINSENFNYKYGNQSLFSLIFSYQTTPKLTLGLEARNENRSKAQRENKSDIQSTGYSLIYAIPHVGYTFHQNWSLSVNAEIPVFRHYNGIQLGNKMAISVRLVRNIDFHYKAALKPENM